MGLGRGPALAGAGANAKASADAEAAVKPLSATQKYRQFLKTQREAPSPPKQNEAPSPPKQNEAPSCYPYKKRFSEKFSRPPTDAVVDAVATPDDVAPDVVAVATVAPSYDVDDVVAATSLLDLAASAPAPDADVVRAATILCDLSASAPAPDADVVRAATILCEIAASPANAREPQQQPQQPLIVKIKKPAAPKQPPLMIKIKKPRRRRAIAPATTRVTPRFSYRPMPDVDEKLCGLYPQNDNCLGCTLPAGHLGNCTTCKNYDAPRIRKRAVIHNV